MTMIILHTGTYFWSTDSKPSNCAQGKGTINDACKACTTPGKCPQSFYHDATRYATCIQGGGNQDACVACTTQGNCKAGEYYNTLSLCASADAGANQIRLGATKNDACAACTVTGKCSFGYYFKTACDGKGTADDSCQPCTANTKYATTATQAFPACFHMFARYR